MCAERPEDDHNTPASTPNPEPAPRIINSADLLCGQREIIIQHGTEQYRLRLTKAGKLILNK